MAEGFTDNAGRKLVGVMLLLVAFLSFFFVLMDPSCTTKDPAKQLTELKKTMDAADEGAAQIKAQQPQEQPGFNKSQMPRAQGAPVSSLPGSPTGGGDTGSMNSGTSEPGHPYPPQTDGVTPTVEHAQHQWPAGGG